MADKLEAVIVCDGYGDFLEHTVPITKSIFDNVIIVTGKGDNYTEMVCKKYDVDYVVGYNHKHNDRFNKALAINHGLAHLSLTGWVVHLDADIVLPYGFKNWFQQTTTLKEDTIYGMDRFNANFDQWEQVKKTDWMHKTRDWGYIIPPPSDLPVNPSLKMGARVGHGLYHSWLPIGFFQMWHAKFKNRYPNKQQSDMEHTDLLHASYWPPDKRILIPDFFCLHLTTTTQMGHNWQGRKSAPFGMPGLKIQSNYIGKNDK